MGAKQHRLSIGILGKGDREVTRIPILKPRIVIGSVDSADLRLVGEGVAPIHAILEVSESGDQISIFDMGKGTSTPVRVGAIIKIGDQKIKLIEESKPHARREDTNPELMRVALPMEVEEPTSPLFREGHRKALEVVMAWHGSILDVQHFAPGSTVTVGPLRSNDFATPDLFGDRRFSLVKSMGDRYSIQLNPKMSGIVHSGSGMISLDKARSQAMGQELILEPSDFAKVGIGELEFFLTYSASPPVLLRHRSRRDPFFFGTWVGSFAFTLAMILALFQVPVPETIEIEQMPERIATILYQPEKFLQAVPLEKPEKSIQPSEQIDPPKIKTTKVNIEPGQQNVKPKTSIQTGSAPSKTKTGAKAASKAQAKAQSSGKEGEGARAKGPVGTRGTKTAQATSEKPQQQARRPSPERGKGPGGSKSAVNEGGALDVLRGAGRRFENILGGVGSRLGKGGSDLKGYGATDTQGSSGLALSGQGTGGGGRADTLGGLGEKGIGGGRVGVGTGASGTGKGILSGSGRVELRQGGPEETVVMGSIDAGAIEAAILAHKDEFRLCYERELNAENSSLAGRVLPLFVIGSSGRVTRAAIKDTTLHNANVERCVITVLRRIQFPMPLGGGIVEVTYPFKFRSLGK